MTMAAAVLLHPANRVVIVASVVGFVFCTLAVLAPAPRDPVRGDNKMIGAILAAVLAGIAVWELIA